MGLSLWAAIVFRIGKTAVDGGFRSQSQLVITAKAVGLDVRFRHARAWLHRRNLACNERVGVIEVLPSPPPLWGRAREGVGSAWITLTGKGSAWLATPYTNPPPQGGREITAAAVHQSIGAIASPIYLSSRIWACPEHLRGTTELQFK